MECLQFGIVPWTELAPGACFIEVEKVWVVFEPRATEHPALCLA